MLMKLIVTLVLVLYVSFGCDGYGGDGPACAGIIKGACCADISVVLIAMLVLLSVNV